MRSILFAAVAAMLTLGSTAVRAEKTASEIQDCVKANLAEKSSIQTITMRTVDRVGVETEFKAKIFWRRFDDGFSRVLVRIHAPEARRGSALLMVEGKDRADIYMYLPELRRVKRVTQNAVQGALFGTDFTYEDFERIQKLAEDTVGERKPDAEVDGRKAYVIELRPARGEESEYTRVVAYIDQERCVPLKMEHFETGDRMRKLISTPANKIGEYGSRHAPQLVRVEDLVDGTHTDMIIEDLELDVEIPAEDFSSGNLEF